MRYELATATNDDEYLAAILAALAAGDELDRLLTELSGTDPLPALLTELSTNQPT